MDEVFFLCPCRLFLHVAGSSVGRSVPTQVDDAWFLHLALGASAGAGPEALGATSRVERALIRYILTEHDDPVVQVADGAGGAAGRTVQTPLWVKLPL